MSATKAVEGWMSDEVRSGVSAGDFPDCEMARRSEVINLNRRQSAEQRFEAEAMPHMNDLYRTALRMTGDRNRAEDVLQEAYLEGWKSFSRFEPGTNCRAWLFKILFHCVSHQRQKWWRFPLLNEAEEYLELNLVATVPIPDKLTDQDILAALDRIPADFRAVILLVDLEEFAYREVAEILSIPIGTVMSRLSRGRKLLREQLADVARSYGIGKAARQGNMA